MQIIVTWSNGMTSELEVEVPPGVTPIQTSFDPGRPETALHQKDDKSLGVLQRQGWWRVDRLLPFAGDGDDDDQMWSSIGRVKVG